MKAPIALEISAISRGGRLTGVGYYVQHLLTALLAEDPQTQYELLWFKDETPPAELLNHPNVTGRLIPLPRRFYKLLLLLNLAPSLDGLSKSRAEVFFFPSFAGWPLSEGKRSVFVIYDTAFIDYPTHLKTKQQGIFLRRSMKSSIEGSTAIVAISESTKQSLVKNFHVDPAKVSVITPAIDHGQLRPANHSEITRATAKFGIKRDYILFLGTLEPRKNIIGTIRAYQSLTDDLKKKYQLVLAGGKGWGDARIQKELQLLGSDDVVTTGYVSEADKSALYSGAELFIYPSFYEGWGMPILEAQACGVPVLAADNSSLPEAGGTAVEYVKAGDQSALNIKLAELMNDEKRRQQLKTLGFKQAANFTWAKSAHQLAELFKQLTS